MINARPKTRKIRARALPKQTRYRSNPNKIPKEKKHQVLREERSNSQHSTTRNALHSSSPLCILHHRRKESRGIIRSVAIRQMSWQDRQCANTNQISWGADDHCFGGREVRNLCIILLLLGVAKGDDASDFGHRGCRHVFDGAVDDSGSLGVAYDGHGGIGTFGCDGVDHILHSLDSHRVGTAGEEVCGETCCVVDALN